MAKDKQTTQNKTQNKSHEQESAAIDQADVASQAKSDAKADSKKQKAEAKQAKQAANAAEKAAKKAKAAASGRTATPMMLSLTLVVALGACGASFWVWTQGNNNADKLQYALSQSRQQSQNEIQRLNSERNALENKLNQVMAQNANQQQQLLLKVDHLNEASKAISDRLGRNSTTWIVAEAEYLLNIANHRLSIERDINTAIAALVAADARLKQVGDPALLPVRRTITAEINSLRSLDMPDISGMAFELASLASSAEQLPLIVKQRREQFDNAFSSTDEVTQQSGTVSGVMKAVWTDLKGLVVIRKNEMPVEALLAPDQRHFLFQNLILKLETARLSLLRGEQENVKASLAVAKTWLHAYFDRESAAYKNFETTMSRISATNLNPALPDITKSHKALRRFSNGKSSNKKTGKSSQPAIKKQVVVKSGSEPSKSEEPQTSTSTKPPVVSQQPSIAPANGAAK